MVVFINGTKEEQRKFDISGVVRYKGQMSDTLLVIEDVIDFSKVGPDRHRCICKCLKCGKIYSRLVTIRQIREKTAKCYCSGKYPAPRYKFLDKRGEMLKFLLGERNKAKQEAVFVEDEERVYMFDMLINFLGSQSLEKYFLKGLDL